MSLAIFQTVAKYVTKYIHIITIWKLSSNLERLALHNIRTIQELVKFMEKLDDHMTFNKSLNWIDQIFDWTCVYFFFKNLATTFLFPADSLVNITLNISNSCCCVVYTVPLFWIISKILHTCINLWVNKMLSHYIIIFERCTYQWAVKNEKKHCFVLNSFH